MKYPTRLFLLLAGLTALLMSIPFLVPHCGWAALRNLQSQFKSVAEVIDLNRELQHTVDPKLKRDLQERKRVFRILLSLNTTPAKFRGFFVFPKYFYFLKNLNLPQKRSQNSLYR